MMSAPSSVDESTSMASLTGFNSEEMGMEMAFGEIVGRVDEDRFGKTSGIRSAVKTSIESTTGEGVGRILSVDRLRA